MWYYDKENEIIYIANDLLSKQSVYYYAKDGLILVNTSFFDLCSDMRAYSRTPEINMAAVEYFCLENVFYGDVTYEKDTFFLTAYSYLVIDCKSKELMVKQLPIPNMQKEISRQNVDTRFCCSKRTKKTLDITWTSFWAERSEEICCSNSYRIDDWCYWISRLNRKG